MNLETYTVRLLGAAQLIVFAASLTSDKLLKSVAGSGGISEIVVNISEHISLIRVSNLVRWSTALRSSPWEPCSTRHLMGKARSWR